MDRRFFLRESLLVSGGLFLCAHSGKSIFSGDLMGGCSEIKIEEPIHGAILNRRQGVEINGGLKIKVEGRAPLDWKVTVNGLAAQREGEKFISEVILHEKETNITASWDGWLGKNQHSIHVLWDKNSFPRYGFEIDDNIFFLRDIARKKYKSLFDCFYLKGLRDLHKKYGTKFLLNLFYSDGALYSNGAEFTLSQFPDRYKKEWEENADWLRLTLHAYSEFPDRPYQHASVDKIIEDLNLVSEHIHRFAGEKTYTPPTILHWGSTNPQAFKSLYEHGVRVLRGYFTKNRQGGWMVNQNLDNTRSEYLSCHESLKDFESGIVFGKADMVLNSTPNDQIIPILEALRADPNQAEIMDLMSHEQYFWPFYENYIPDHFTRFETAIRWASENDYRPVFWNDGFMGVPDE